MKNIMFVLLLATFAAAQTKDCPRCVNYSTLNSMNAGASSFGAGMAVAAERHRFHKFCDANPGQVYRNGTVCPDHFAFARWVLDHPKFHQSDANMDKIFAYLSANNINPNEYKSYDKAFKALRKAGTIEVNK